MARTHDWAAYYERLKDRPPRTTTTFAARRFPTPGDAVDLGCGGGRDTLPLLDAGWNVLGVDQEPSAIEALTNEAAKRKLTGLKTLLSPFEAAEWGEVDFVVSSFALPLAPKPDFPALWAHIRASLRPGGRFAGQLYGVRDSWARNGAPDGVVAFTRAECLAHLEGMRIELFEEEEHDGVTARGKSKHWHIFHIVAQQP